MKVYKTIWFRVVRIVLLVYAVIFFIGCCCPNALIFQPPGTPYSVGNGIECIPTPDGETLAVLYQPATKAGYPTILYNHGNAENLAFAGELLAPFADKGYGICAYDYRGYGLSTGKPNEENCYNDAETVYTYLTSEKKIPPESIVVHGRSLGGAMAVHLASQKPVAGLVLESAFVSAFRVATRIPLLPFDRFKNSKSITEITCPIFIIHGTADNVIGCWHGRRLYELANEPKLAWWVEGAGHNNLMIVAGINEYYTMIDTFYRDLFTKKH